MSEKIVVGSDGSVGAKRAVQEAVRLGKAVGAEVHVVMASRSLRNALMDRSAAGASLVFESMSDDVPQAIVEEAVAAARVRGVVAEGHVVDREAADALLAVADRVGASMIVVGNRGMSGGRRILSSVPNKVSHGARCNVLIVATG